MGAHKLYLVLESRVTESGLSTISALLSPHRRIIFAWDISHVEASFGEPRSWHAEERRKRLRNRFSRPPQVGQPRRHTLNADHPHRPSSQTMQTQNPTSCHLIHASMSPLRNLHGCPLTSRPKVKLTSFRVSRPSLGLVTLPFARASRSTLSWQILA